jgi:hypothetical protein
MLGADWAAGGFIVDLSRPPQAASLSPPEDRSHIHLWNGPEPGLAICGLVTG